MHVVVALLLIVPIVLELLAFGSARASAALAWLPLRAARRRVSQSRLGGAYRDAPGGIFEKIALPQSVLTPKGERVRIDVATRSAWARLRRPGLTFVRMQIVDTEEGFDVVGTALPVPVLGFVLGVTLMSVAAMEISGPSILVLPAAALVAAFVAARSAWMHASERLDGVADALVAHVAAERERDGGEERTARGATGEDAIENDHDQVGRRGGRA